MKKISYTTALSPDDLMHIDLTVHNGKILKFVVQYHARIDKGWRTIIRVDNAHNFVHKDKYYLNKKRVKIDLKVTDLNKVFNQAKSEIKRDFIKIKENFLLH